MQVRKGVGESLRIERISLGIGDCLGDLPRISVSWRSDSMPGLRSVITALTPHNMI